MSTREPAHKFVDEAYEHQRLATAAIFERLSNLEHDGLLHRATILNELSSVLVDKYTHGLSKPRESPNTHTSQQLLCTMRTPSGETLFVGEMTRPTNKGERRSYFVSAPPGPYERRAHFMGVIEPDEPLVIYSPQPASDDWSLSFSQPAGSQELHVAQANQPFGATVAFTAANEVMAGQDSFPLALWAPTSNEVVMAIGHQVAHAFELTTIIPQANFTERHPNLRHAMQQGVSDTVARPHQHQ